ncbi:hypothetical protein BaRGS_00012267 [Batillaria attramentaria]|uniref:Uncharacterized protein n=1 Tax=Batillaria attramentaria TaxID=370345 RepID=A0ABD0LBH8_9CAEN
MNTGFGTWPGVRCDHKLTLAGGGRQFCGPWAVTKQPFRHQAPLPLKPGVLTVARDSGSVCHSEADQQRGEDGHSWHYGSQTSTAEKIEHAHAHASPGAGEATWLPLVTSQITFISLILLHPPPVRLSSPAGLISLPD